MLYVPCFTMFSVDLRFFILEKQNTHIEYCSQHLQGQPVDSWPNAFLRSWVGTDQLHLLWQNWDINSECHGIETPFPQSFFFGWKTWSKKKTFFVTPKKPSKEQCGSSISQTWIGTGDVIAFEIRSWSPKHSPICSKGRHRLKQKMKFIWKSKFPSLILDDIGIYYKDMLGMLQCLLIAVCSFCIMRCGNPWEGPAHQRMLQQAIGSKMKIPSFAFSLTNPL